MNTKPKQTNFLKAGIVLMISLTLLLSGTTVLAIKISNPQNLQPETGTVVQKTPDNRNLITSRIIYVPNDYPTIQGAINAANNGDTVFVHNGTYYENIVVNKAITLTGENKDTTFIHGTNTISAAHVQLSRFTIQNTSIYITADYANITDLIISGGVDINHASYTRITYSTIMNAGYAGIYFRSNVYHTSIIGNTFLYDDSAIAVYNGSDIVIAGNTISQCGWGIDLWPCDHVQIIGNSIYNNDAYGIQIAESSFITITGNQIYNNEQGIDIYGSGDTIMISENTVRNHTGGGGIILEGLSNPQFSNCVITQNTIEHNGYGLLLAYVTGSTVTNNTFTDNSLTIYCMKPEDANTHTIEGNTVNGEPIRYYKNMQVVAVPQNTGEVIMANCTYVSVIGLTTPDIETSIELLYCTHGSVTGNSIYTSRFPVMGGLFTQNSTDIHIQVNEITDGISLGSSQGCIVTKNNFTITQQYGWGVYLWGTSYSEVSQNTFTSSISNQGFGIGLEQASYNQITKNNVENLGEGIALLDQANYNTFTENTQTNNGIGFDIMVPMKGKESTHLLSFPSCLKGTDKGGPQQYPCYNNTIYHNNFITNMQQAYDASSNIWDNGYPSGGNYWSDYTGPDANHDGIGDIPYNVTGGNQDGYPLMNPYGTSTTPMDIYVDDDYTPSTPGWGIDHFATIQNGVNAVAGDGTVHVFSGIYHENVVIAKTLSLIGENKDTTIIDAGSGTAITVSAPHTQISHFTIQKNSGSGSSVFVHADYTNIIDDIISGWYDCVEIYQASYTSITSSTLMNANDGIEVADSSFVTIANNQIYNNAQGIYIYSSGDSIMITGNTIRNNTYGAAIMGFPEPLSNCIISQNIVEHNMVGLLLGYYISNSIINNNTFIGDSLTLYCNRLEDANTQTIEGNTVNGRPLRYYKNMQGVNVPQDTGEVIIANCNNISVQNLTIHDRETSIELLYCNGATITGNSISASVFLFGGLLVQNSTGLTIEHNQFTDGIALIGSQGCSVSLNNFIIAQEYSLGLYFWGTSHSEVSQNTFTSSISNQGIGIGLEQSTYNQITKNRVENIQGEGIVLIDQSSYNIFTENTLTNSGLGFDIRVPQKGKESTHLLSLPSCLKGTDKGGPTQYPCYNNTIYHNNFITNTQQAYDAASNIWDNGYPSGGNYWSDYTGPDANHDGIGDMPYYIYDSGQDRYPLMHQFKLGDVNNDGWVTFADIDPFVAALGTTEAQFQAQHPTWSWLAADCNQDGAITFADIDPFVLLIGS